MNNLQINKILNDLESGYDQMADKFSQTRKFFWRDLEFIADYVENGDKILDYGCGNGRLLEILKDKKIEYTGADVSQKLIEIAQNKHPEHKFIKLDSQSILPFPDEYFNKIISIAVFHHFPEEYAQKMAKELFRTVRPQGKIIVTVWNLSQDKFKEFMAEGSKDLHIPFKDNKGKVFRRYHRFYTKSSLEKIFSKAGFSVEKSEVINEKNIVLIASK